MDPLNEFERRVLGCLLEKSMAQPEYYPMSLNALTAACNQKNNRDPVMEIDEDSVWQAVEQLRARGLTARVLPAPGARTDRFKHEVDGKWQLPKAQKAILTELLIRGPQTVGELRTRAGRLYAFENLEAVTAVLEWLATQPEPWIEALPKTPGHAAIRYAHRLYPPEESAALRSSSGPAAATPPPRALSVPSPGSSAGGGELRQQIESMQSEIADLHSEIAALRRRLDALEGR
jgi:uncharacterized protein